MKTILIILFIVVILSHMSQVSSLRYKEINSSNNKSVHMDFYLVCLIIFLTLLAGLRISYNDTGSYIMGYNAADSFETFMSNPENLKITSNPLFYGLQSFCHMYIKNVNTFFIICALFENTLLIRFIKRHTRSSDFTFSMFVYTCLGMVMFSLAAQKQILAMSVLTLALDKLFEKKYIKYYLIVLIAGLLHTYAFMFLFLPLFDTELWSLRTYLLVFLTLIFMYTFQTSIEALLKIADQVGKSIDSSSIYNSGMNRFRVMVYGVVPVLSFLFKGRFRNHLNREDRLFVQMSIISFMLMLLGTINGANLFGRSAYYFSLGFICVLPSIIKCLFNRTSSKIIIAVALLCFTLFYCYDNKGFKYDYRYKSIIEYLGEIR